jgi:uncharacterized membrane protein
MRRSGKRREENEIEFARIVAFSDGVFAIAITLLILAVAVPADLHGESLTDALWGQHQSLLANALSFAVIGRFWLVHHRFFSEVTGFDNRLLGLNLFYLAWIVLLPFSTQVIGDHGDEAAAAILYAINLAGIVLVGLWMTLDARRAGLASGEEETEEESIRRALGISGVFIASIPVALFSAGIAELMWLYLFIQPRLVRVIRDGR